MLFTKTSKVLALMLEALRHCQTVNQINLYSIITWTSLVPLFAMSSVECPSLHLVTMKWLLVDLPCPSMLLLEVTLVRVVVVVLLSQVELVALLLQEEVVVLFSQVVVVVLLSRVVVVVLLSQVELAALLSQEEVV